MTLNNEAASPTPSALCKLRDDVLNIDIMDHRRSDEDGVALCAIQKDAEGVIDEWLNYYFGLGVSRIFIYDNSDYFDLEG